MANPPSADYEDSTMAARIRARPDILNAFNGINEIVGTFIISLADGRVARLEVEKLLKATDNPYGVACYMVQNGAWVRDIVFPWRRSEDAAGALEQAMGLLQDRWNLR